MKRSYKDLIQANVSTVKTHLGRLLRQVKRGEEVIILDRNHPVAKIVPFSPSSEEENKLPEIPPVATWQSVERALKARESKRKLPRLKRTSLFYLNQDREGR